MPKETCKGIVLRKIDYSDSSLIIKALTEHNGVKSFLFQGGKRKNKKGNTLQALSIVQFEYYERSDSDLGKISNVEQAYVYKEIPFNPYKSSIVFFLSEVIQKTVHENESEHALYQFLENALIILDETDHYANFVTKFLLQFPRYLGFSIPSEKSAKYFDYHEAKFVKYQPAHPYYIKERESELLLELLGMKFDGEKDPKIDLNTRRALIYEVLKVYNVFFDNFKEVKSLSVLEAALH